MKMFCLLFSCGVVLSFRWRTWCLKSSRRPRSATWRRMIWRLKTSSSVLFGPPRSNSSRNWITCWTLSAAWRNRTKNCASVFCLLLLAFTSFTRVFVLHQTNQIVFWLQRKAGRRRSNEGVAGPARGWAIFFCECFFFLQMTWKQLASTHCAFKIFLLKMHAVYSCQNNIRFLLIAKSSVK